MTLRSELHALEAATFEIEEAFTSDHAMLDATALELAGEELAAAATSSSCSCSSCCSCSTSSCCSCSTSCSSCG